MANSSPERRPVIRCHVQYLFLLAQIARWLYRLRFIPTSPRDQDQLLRVKFREIHSDQLCGGSAVKSEPTLRLRSALVGVVQHFGNFASCLNLFSHMCRHIPLKREKNKTHHIRKPATLKTPLALTPNLFVESPTGQD